MKQQWKKPIVKVLTLKALSKKIMLNARSSCSLCMACNEWKVIG